MANVAPIYRDYNVHRGSGAGLQALLGILGNVAGGAASGAADATSGVGTAASSANPSDYVAGDPSGITGGRDSLPVVARPGLMSRIFTPGSNLSYQNYLQTLSEEQAKSEQEQQLEKVRGNNTLANTRQVGSNAQEQAKLNSAIDTLKQYGVGYDEATAHKNLAELNQRAMEEAALKQGTSTNVAKAQQEESGSPEGQSTTKNAFLASTSRPLFENSAMGRVNTPPGDLTTMFDPANYGGPRLSLYNKPPGISSSTSKTTTMENGFPRVVDTTSTTPVGGGPDIKSPLGFGQGVGSINPNLTLSQYKKEQEGQDDDSDYEANNVQNPSFPIQAKPATIVPTYSRAKDMNGNSIPSSVNPFSYPGAYTPSQKLPTQPPQDSNDIMQKLLESFANMGVGNTNQ